MSNAGPLVIKYSKPLNGKHRMHSNLRHLIASMEAVTLPHLPDHPLMVCLFKDVKNASFLRQQLLDSNTEFEYAFLDATTIISRNHILAACFRAINDQLSNRLKSRNVHSEIVFSLSLNNNVRSRYHFRVKYFSIITIFILQV